MITIGHACGSQKILSPWLYNHGYVIIKVWSLLVMHAGHRRYYHHDYIITDMWSSKYDHYGSCMRGRERPKPAAASSSLPKSLSKSSIANIDLDKNRQYWAYNVYIFTQISSNLKIQICCVNLLRCFFSSRKRFSRPNGPLLPKACYTPKIYASQDFFF